LVDLERRQWVPFLEYPGATFAAMVYAYILFMVFPIYNTVQTLDPNQIDAARDLGASTWRIHRRVVIPHAKPGIAVGCIMTFMLSAGSYSVPQIMTRGLGGDWFSQLIYRQFFEANNWNIGAAYAFALLLACILFIFVVMRVAGVGIRDIAR
jgi:spermidine/putrescine transport system permease protein